MVSASLLSLPLQAADILLGCDYFKTVQPTFYTPLDGLGMGILNPLRGLAIGDAYHRAAASELHAGSDQRRIDVHHSD